jgi:general stress protein YciG
MIMNAQEMGQKGGRNRAKALSAERRREIAIKAGKASGRARKTKTQNQK